MATINPPVIGTEDGIEPIRDENAPWRMWGLKDIFVGTIGSRRFVPKVNDYVIQPTTYETWIVLSVNPVTLIPELMPIRPFGSSTEPSREDILFGVGPGTQAQLLRVYLNRNTYPYRLTVDTHCFVGGSAMAHAVIYKNGDPTIGGEPVSKMYDNSGNFLGVEVPLELVALDTHDINSSIKIVQECYCNEEIPDGEPLLVVFYSADGIPRSKATLLCENTTYIRGIDIQRKFVTNISLESPWISGDANVIKFPLNIPTDALDLKGVVQYNDGSRLRLPVDGTKFSLAGMDGYLSSIPGEQFDAALIYSLSAEEISYAGQGMYVDRVVTAPYTIITEVIEPGYTVKLFMYPFWNATNSSYRMRYWLYNMSRNSHVEVTDYVKYAASIGGFDPRLWGVKQRLQVNLNLRDISPNYKPMIHTQMFDVTLFGIPSDNDTPWTVSNQLSPSVPPYGINIKAVFRSPNVFNLSSIFTTKEDWIKAYYDNTDPIVDRRTEVYNPVPAHFWVSTNDGVDWTQYFLNDSWDKDLTSRTPLTLYQNILLRFTRPVGLQTADLAIAAVTVQPD